MTSAHEGGDGGGGGEKNSVLTLNCLHVSQILIYIVPHAQTQAVNVCDLLETHPHTHMDPSPAENSPKQKKFLLKIQKAAGLSMKLCVGGF